MKLVARTKKILLHPKQEWRVVDAESTSAGALYRAYIAPLAAIGPIASLAVWSLVGLHPSFEGTFRVPINGALRQSVIEYGVSLVGVFVFALIIDALAPAFGARKNRLQALKVAAYSSSAVWVVGIVDLVPALSFLDFIGVYGFYVLYVGLPVLMKPPESKATAYTAAVIICAIVLFFVLRAAAAPTALVWGADHR